MAMVHQRFDLRDRPRRRDRRVAMKSMQCFDPQVAVDQHKPIGVVDHHHRYLLPDLGDRADQLPAPLAVVDPQIAMSELELVQIHVHAVTLPALARDLCLDHLGTLTQLHDVHARLLAFLDEHYHRAPHGGLFGKYPVDVWATATLRPVDEAELATALTTRARRRVRRDGTLDVEGQAW